MVFYTINYNCVATPAQSLPLPKLFKVIYNQITVKYQQLNKLSKASCPVLLNIFIYSYLIN